MGLRTLILVAVLAAFALAAVPTASATVSGCVLVTKAEAAKALEVRATTLAVFRPGRDCTYRQTYPGKREFLFAWAYGGSRIDDQTYELLMQKRFGGMRKVSGIAGADLAVWQPYYGLRTGITVFAENRMFTLSMYGVAKAKAEPRIKALAAKAISRLPA